MTNETSPSDLILQAIPLKRTSLTLVPARHDRPWMDATIIRFANRCLPLLIANQYGWDVVTDGGSTATWSGGNESRDTVIVLDDAAPSSDPPESHFGYGIITWIIPFLFRTPPGWNLLARGPANAPKDGVAALEGIVETDWTYTPFTMNWKITRPNHTVRFEAGETICTLVPLRRGEIERFSPEFHDGSDAAAGMEKFRAWSENRRAFAADPANRSGWQKHYLRGEMPWGERAPEHQTRLRLRPFAKRPPNAED